MAGVAAVATIFGTVATMQAQNEAREAAEEQADQEKRMAQEEAAAIESETAENVRRARRAAAAAEGESTARAAASGLDISGGSINYALDDMSQEHDRQLEWMAKAGASRARAAIMGGDMRSDAAKSRASQLKAQMWGTAFQGAGNTYTQGKDAGWWGA